MSEYIESSISGASNCPKCSQPLTVDLSKETQDGDDDQRRRKPSRTRATSSNKAGTVCVAGRVKVRIWNDDQTPQIIQRASTDVRLCVCVWFVSDLS